MNIWNCANFKQIFLMHHRHDTRKAPTICPTA